MFSEGTSTVNPRSNLLLFANHDVCFQLLLYFVIMCVLCSLLNFSVAVIGRILYGF